MTAPADLRGGGAARCCACTEPAWGVQAANERGDLVCTAYRAGDQGAPTVAARVAEGNAG